MCKKQAALAGYPVVVVGMGMNLFPKKARRALDAAEVAYHYLEYGNYLEQLALSAMPQPWTGWPTFPMVFVKGTLVGGASELAKLINSGELKKMLA